MPPQGRQYAGPDHRANNRFFHLAKPYFHPRGSLLAIRLTRPARALGASHISFGEIRPAPLSGRQVGAMSRGI
jgi:hypothetical protein